MLDIIQYEFNISIRLMKDFFESESAWPLIEGMARSWALVRSLLLAWLIGGNRWCRVCPGFLNISPNIRSSAESKIWANAGWVFGKKPPSLPFSAHPPVYFDPAHQAGPTMLEMRMWVWLWRWLESPSTTKVRSDHAASTYQWHT